MHTSMNSAFSFVLFALIPATIAYPNSGPLSPNPVPALIPRKDNCAAPPAFPQPIEISTTPSCSTNGAIACTVDETSLLTCTDGKWVAKNCGQKNGYQLACRSYFNTKTKKHHCPAYSPIYTECTGYEDGDVSETVSSQVGWDAQPTPKPSVNTSSVLAQTTSPSVPKASPSP